MMTTKEIQAALEANKQRNRMRQLKQLESKMERVSMNENQLPPKIETLVAVEPTSNAKTLRNRRRRQRRRKTAQQRQMALSDYVFPGIAPPQLRDGTMGNPVDPRTSRTVRQMGQTALGANWALRALHPCGEGINIVPKIPDGALTDSVILERRDEFNIKYPSVWDAKTYTTWNVIIINLPVLKTPIIAIAYQDSVGEMDLQTAWIDALAHFGDRTMETTTDFDATYVYPSWHKSAQNAGIAITILNMANLDKNKAAISMSNEFLTIRRTYEGTTMDFDANALTNKGRLISGQIASDLSKETIDIVPDSTKGLTETQSAYIYADVPLTETEMTQQDSKVRQAEAICGDYAPCRFWEPVFNNSTSKDVAAFDSIDPNGKDQFVTAAKTNINIPLYGWGIKVNYWLSIDNTSSIRIKRREGLEMNTSSTSDYSPFSTPAFPRDDRAQTVFREFCREQSHSFDANYNSLGGMLKDIISTIGGVLGNLGLPVISDIAKAATPVLTSIADVIPI